MNEKEEIIEMLEVLKDESDPKPFDKRTTQVYVYKESFDFVMEKAIEYIKEH